MAKSNDYRMAIKIAGEIEKSLYNSTDLTRKELNKIAREAARTSSLTKDSFEQGLSETEPLFDGLEKAGTKAFNVLATAAAAAGTAIIGIGTASANVGIDFESSFAGVKKTTDATAQEYALMKKEILEMTREIPAVGTEIAEVAEAAGQLGIEKKNLLAFTRTMIDLGESTNLAATEGASDLAKFANITKMSADNYGRLGSTIVALGNNFATTEADIVAMGTNLASAGELANFTEAQILATATAISSVGIEAEAGGSAMSKMIKNVQVAVETGNKSLKKYASVAGMSVNEFKETFEKDGLAAVASFISGLNDVERNGKSATVILNEMGLTEARLSNTLLSLANADGLMLEAVEMANKAWEENTALTKEAAQRYETTESKLAIMKNGFTEMGIAIYDQFNEPLRDGIDMITELVHEATEDISGSTVIHDIAQDIVDGIPTAIRVLEQTTEVVGDFAEPFLEVGGWLVDHPKLLTSTIIGVGTALTTYKVVKGVSSLATALSALGPASVPIMGVAGGITALAGAGTYLTQHIAELREEMIQANLDEHFGNMALSMEEVNEAARRIVGDRYLDQLDEIMSASVTSDNLIRSMEESIREINEMRWELSVGVTFSAEDKTEYAETAQQYIQDVQSFINNEGYTFQLSAELLLAGSVNMNEIIADNNAFYKELSDEMTEIGDEISTIINTALKDGLEIDPEQINAALEDAQKIQDALTEGQSKAKLEAIKAKYSGQELNEESFQKLMQEVNEYTAESDEQLWNTYTDNIGRIEGRKIYDEDYTQEQYEADKAEFLKGAKSRQLETMTDAYSFLFNTLDGTYGSDADSLEQYIRDGMKSKMNSEDYDGTYSAPEIWGYQMQNIAAGAENAIDDLGSSEAVKLLMQYAEPYQDKIEELSQWVERNGGVLDKDTQDKLSDFDYKSNLYGALAGDEQDLWEIMGDIAGENKDYSAVLEAAYQQNAAVLPQTFIDAIKEKQPEAEQMARDYIGSMKQIMGEGYDVTVPIGIYYDVVSEFGRTGKINKELIGGYSEGGIVTQPEIAWLAEGGYSESVIPHDGSQRSISLWQQTGEILGVFNRKDGFHSLKENLLSDYGSGGSSVSNTVNNSEDSRNIVFSPTIQISGNADRREIEDAMEWAFEKFEELLEQHERNKERYSFQ